MFHLANGGRVGKSHAKKSKADYYALLLCITKCTCIYMWLLGVCFPPEGCLHTLARWLPCPGLKLFHKTLAWSHYYSS